MPHAKLLIAGLILSAASAVAHPGVGITADAQGNVFYTDLKQVWKLSRDGQAEIAVPNVHTHELWLDAQGNLFGEHLWYEGDRTGKWGHYIWKRRPDGQIEKVTPPTEGFLQDQSFVRDQQGNMYWAAPAGPVTRIRRRSAAGGRLETIAEAHFRDVRRITVTPDGVVYLVDQKDLVRLSRQGKPEVMARDVARNHVLIGLSADARGNVYVAVMADSEVKRVSPAGVVTTIAKSPANWSPTGVFATPEGDLWVLESGALRPDGALNVRARKIRIAAAVIAMAGAAGGIVWMKQRPPGPREYRVTQLTRDIGVTRHPGISGDGHLVVYASDRATGQDSDIWIQHVDPNPRSRLFRRPPRRSLPPSSEKGIERVESLGCVSDDDECFVWQRGGARRPTRVGG